MTLAARWTLLWLLLVGLVVGQYLTAQAPPAPSDRDIVSLREYLEGRVQCEKELVAEQRKTAQLALDLQASENNRRLEALNHEAAQLKSMQATYAPRESFEMATKDTTKRLDEIALRLEKSDAENASGRRILALFMGGLALLITVLTYLRRRPTPLPPSEPGMKANGLK